MAIPKNARIVYALPTRLYVPGAPVWITGGELLRAQELLYCRLRLSVLCRERVKSVTVAIQPLDGQGRRAGLALPYRYRCNLGRDGRIGEKEAILLPLEEAASFTVRVTRVDFVEAAPWLCSRSWESVPAQQTLEEHYGDPELAEQFRIRYGRDCRYALMSLGDLWLCTCAAVNLSDESACRRCHRIRAAMEKVNADTLRAETAERRLKEPLRERAARTEKRAALKRLLIGAGIVLPILILMLGLLTAVPRELERRSLYDGAQRLVGLGEFESARATFASLGDYRDSREMAGVGMDYLRASELMRRAALDDASALQSIGHTRADLNEETSAATLLYEAAQQEFEALGDYKDSAKLAQSCAEGLAASRAALYQAALDRAETLLESGKLSEAREAYLALGAEEEAKEPAYRKAASLVKFIQTYNIRGIYASLSMDSAVQSRFSLPKNTALTLGTQCIPDLLASCGEDPVDLRLEDVPGSGLVPLDEAVKALLGGVEGYKNSAELLAAIDAATDYTREFFTLCENGDLAGAYEWLSAYDGAFEDRERWLADLALYLPFCSSWELYLGDTTVIPLTVGRGDTCMEFQARVLLQDGGATLRLTDAGGEYSIDLYAAQGENRFFNREQEGVFYLVVVTGSGHLSYLKYRNDGTLISSCEYAPV